MQYAELVSGLIEALGADNFGEALDAFIGGLVSFDLTAVYFFPTGEPPLPLHDGYRNFASNLAVDNYIKGTYLVDTVYHACLAGVDDGLYRHSKLAGIISMDADYVRASETYPCISINSGALAEELVYFAATPAGRAAYSVMRAAHSPAFSQEEFAALESASPIIVSCMRRNWQHLTAPSQPPIPAKTQSRVQAVSSFADGALTRRELEVVVLLLQGHSVTSLSRQLEISEGTVKNHKRSIYAKLAISSQSELFAKFLAYSLVGASTSNW